MIIHKKSETFSVNVKCKFSFLASQSFVWSPYTCLVLRWLKSKGKILIFCTLCCMLFTQ